jgi:hypothetical protein
LKSKTDDELANIVRLKPNTSDARSAAIEIERRLHQPETIFGMSVAKLALLVSVAALVLSLIALFAGCFKTN